MLYSTAYAESNVWSDPSKNPWREDAATAILMLADQGAPYIPLVQLAYKYSKADCTIRDLIPYEHFDWMVFEGGAAEDVTVRSDLFPPGESREVADCYDQYGNHLLYPIAGGNWSYKSDWLPSNLHAQ